MKNKLSFFVTACLVLIAVQANCQWNTVCNSGNGFVANFENFNGELYATGFFNTICGTPCNHVAKYNGSSWQSVGNSFSDGGHHLQVINNELYGVGYQPAIDSNWLYKFDGTNFNKFGEGVYLTTAVAGLSQTANLYSIINYNGQIVVCGEFDRVGNKAISGIMRWTGTAWDSLGEGLSGHNPLDPNPSPVMYPHDMCLFGSDLVVCGDFQFAGGLVVSSIARWDGTQWHLMDLGFNGAVYGVGVYNGELYAGGDFTMSGTTPLRSIAKWNGAHWVDPGFRFFYSGAGNYSYVHSLKTLNNKLIIGGGFDKVVFGVDTMNCTAIASYNGTTIDTLYGGITGKEIEALAVYDSTLFAGGGLNGSSYVARYGLPSVIQETDRSNESLSIFPNPSGSDVHIVSEVMIDELIVSDMLGRVIWQTSPKEKQVVLKLEDEGIYFATISSGKERTTRKIVVCK